jgi:hypothetical protein
VRHGQKSRGIFGLSDDASFYKPFFRDLRYKKSVLHMDIFSIENHRVVCGIFQDITKPAIHKEAMIEKAQEVIKKNQQTVQQIASLPGENAVESEEILNSIIQSVTTEVV